MATEAVMTPSVPRRGPGRIVSHPARDVRERVDLGGVLVDRVAVGAAVDRIRGFLHSGTVNQVATVNLDFVAIARRSPDFRAILNDAELSVADGMPLVWLSHLMGQPVPERLTGVELVDECCRVAVETDTSVFLLGAAPGVAEVAAGKLRERFPGLRIAGVYTPPFGPLSEAENDEIIRQVNLARPDFLFVALGAPHQDVWIAENRDRLDVSVAMGVGCVLDLLAGVVDRAPRWMQRTGLEWLFRLIQEPRRLWKRYIVDDLPVFGWLVVQTLLRERGPVAPLHGAPARRSS